ncbi:MAG: sensor histidine kinase [Acholeplasmataceae bacterium]
MRQKTIKKRLIWAMIGVSIIPIVALSSFTFSYLSQNLRSEFMTTNETRLSWASQYADTLIDQTADTFYALRLNQTLLSAMKYDETNELQSKQYIIDTLNQILYANANIFNEIILYDNQTGHMTILNYRSGGSFFTLDIEDTVFETLIQNPSGLMFVNYNGVPYVIHSINRFDDQAFTGGIAFRLNNDIMAKFQEILGTKTGGYYVLNTFESPISRETSDINLENYMLLANQDIFAKNINYDVYDHHMIWSTRTTRHELTLIKVIPNAVYDAALRPIQFITFGIALIALAISILLSYMISNKISRPISRIVTKMQQAPLDLISIRPDHYDEINQLEKGYNDMSDAIKTLINEKYVKNLELKTAQLKALQSQMNPHFLNNTFQLIGGMALSIKANDIYEITANMGEMMTYALTKDQELLRLSEEVRHVENYLKIQRQRFAHLFQSSLSYDASMMNYLIPKFTLQPLVENSFKHGFKSVEGAWDISIDIVINQDIIITIKDNGSGMTDEKAESINESLTLVDTALRSESYLESTGIGLKNINQRIRLLFGDAYGLKIKALPSGGTMVTVSIPKILTREVTHV